LCNKLGVEEGEEEGFRKRKNLNTSSLQTIFSLSPIFKIKALGSML